MTDRSAPSALRLPRRDLLRGGMAGMLAASLPGSAFAGSGDDALRQAIMKGQPAAIDRLREWIALPSIAAEGRDMDRGAAFMRDLALGAGFDRADIIPTGGAPGVFATLDVGAPRTLGLYFMYDVKQFDAAEWSSPPLEGRLVDRPNLGTVMVGRGALNQKGPQATLLAGLYALRALGRKPPVNLVLVAEGEEEIASPHFHEIVARPQVLAALRKCVGVIIPESWQSPVDGGVVVKLGAKGILEFELVVSGKAWGRGPQADIHSSDAAIVDSPAWRLIGALSTLTTDGGNRPTIDGLMDKVRPMSARDRELIAQAARQINEAGYKKARGVTHWVDDLPWTDTLTRLSEQPTVNIQGLVSGHTGPGGKTVLPARAAAKIEMRLVPDMTKDDTLRLLRAHLDRHGYGDVEIDVTGGYDPTETAENSALVRACVSTYERAGVPVIVYPRLAGSWPGVVFTGDPVRLPAGQFGLGHGANAHAPDEYYLIDSANPQKILGMAQAAYAYIDFMAQIARVPL
ncbi:M20/M25/M40 family metallo-hydrolase [Sphingobium sp.]|uniref:M20/M25/M40 family metallo-hydrolase n=1 Tax=Sphingobium sp. TaxID=1912891 RepID=UPI003B3B3261